MRLLGLIKAFLECPKKLDACLASESVLAKRNAELEDDIQAKRVQLADKDRFILEKNKALELLQGNPVDNKWESYWNSKYPKKDIFYAGRTVPSKPNCFSVDVRLFFCGNDISLVNIVNTNKLNSGTNDERALKCLKWVRANFEYKHDKDVTGLVEYWMFPFEALYYKQGDCDDGGILLANLMLQAGVPYWRVRLNAGDVGSEKKKIGHCYVTYCRESDNEFVVLDWCYLYNNKPVSERLLHKDERSYYGIWFSWNKSFAFGSSGDSKLVFK